MDKERKKMVQKHCHIVKIPRDEELHKEWNTVHELLEGYVECLYGEVLVLPVTDKIVVYFPKDLDVEGMYIQKKEDPHTATLKQKALTLFQNIFKQGEVLTRLPETPKQ